MKVRSVLIAVLLLLAANMSVLAQDEWEESDFLEAAIYGGLGIPCGGITSFGDSLGAKSGFGAGLEVGFYIDPQWVLGLNFTYTQFGVADNDGLVDSDLHHKVYSPNLYLKYFFPSESNLVPYLKVHAGVDFPKFATYYDGSLAGHNDNGYRELSYGACVAGGFGGGLFYYTSDYGGFFVEANYHQGFSSDLEHTWASKSFGNNIGDIDIHAGIRIVFGSDE